MTKTLLVLVFLFASPLLAQFAVRTETKTNSPEDIVRRFEAPEMISYTLGKGDEITVEVWNHPELSGKHVVGPDGKISLPVAGELALANLTRGDAQKAIAATLSRLYSDLAVTLRVDRYSSYRIFILGRVGNPGGLLFESQPTILDVITRAASLPIGGINADKGGLGRCAIIRGRVQMIWLDLKGLVADGNFGLNIRLQRDDLVYMPDAGDQLVYVLGEVQHPGAFRHTLSMSVLDAFTQAGGVTQDAADNKLEVVRGASGEQKEFRLKDLLSSPQSLNVALEEGDILYVPRRNLAKFGYILQKTSYITGFAVLGSLAAK
jgi:polysaccharide export outer membrane protein